MVVGTDWNYYILSLVTLQLSTNQRYNPEEIGDKSDIKRRITLGCLAQYTCRGMRLWNSRDHEAFYGSLPGATSLLTKLFCTSGPNLVTLAWTPDELARGQSSSSELGNIWFYIKFDLEGQGQVSVKTIGGLTKVFCTCCPNSVISAWMGHELSHGQTQDKRTDGRTHTHTHTQAQATTIPEQKIAWIYAK